MDCPWATHELSMDYAWATYLLMGYAWATKLELPIHYPLIPNEN